MVLQTIASQESALLETASLFVSPHLQVIWTQASVVDVLAPNCRVQLSTSQTHSITIGSFRSLDKLWYPTHPTSAIPALVSPAALAAQTNFTVVVALALRLSFSADAAHAAPSHVHELVGGGAAPRGGVVGVGGVSLPAAAPPRHAAVYQQQPHVRHPGKTALGELCIFCGQGHK